VALADERRRSDDAWREDIERRVTAGEALVSELTAKLEENTKITQRIDAGVGEILSIFAALKGFVTVGGWLGTAIKWVAGVLIAAGIIWLVLKTGDLPRKP
jgi:hypothetical protein